MKKLTKEKRKLLINGILLITSVILIMGTSYAWLTLTLTATKTNVIKVGTLLLNLYDQTSIAIDQDKAVPVYDEIGLETDAYTFTLSNEGDIESEYTIYLDDVALLAKEKRMEDKDIRYQLIINKGSETTVIDDLVNLGGNPNRILDSGVINPDEEYSYSLKLWMSSEAQNDAMGTTFRGKIRVEASQIIQKVLTYVMMNGSNFNEVIQNYAPDATSVVFTDTAAPSTASITDVSDAGDGSVVAWLDDTTYYVSSQRSGVKVIANEDCSEMFYGRTGLTSINLSMLDTSAATNMDAMFYGCSALQSVTFPEGFGQAAIIMDYMFYSCSALQSVTFPEGFGQAATYMSDMFDSCSALQSVTFPEGFGQAATYMGGMFSRCSSLTSLTFPEGFGQAATNMSSMFYSCSALQSVTFPEGFGQAATDMHQMFYSCSALQSITFPEGFGQAATDMEGMFSWCLSLTSLTFPEGFGQAATRMNQMFYSCSALQSVTFPEGFGQAAYDMSDMFRECSSLTLDCSGWNVDNVTIYYGFDTDADGVTPPAWVN